MAELGPAEAQERVAPRLRQVPRRHRRVDGRPLVLFLDDLQWSDPGSLALLERTLADADAHHLMIIGAYRDNEVAAGHPLLGTLERIREASPSQRLTLQPLAPAGGGRAGRVRPCTASRRRWRRWPP